ncbi:MAG TPA: hypothetical protein VKT51_11640 [Candidatus Eremiobacteraceae bacterium]|nr:hypothetical protein [Candidatus Eremiobacteraceae bacterium]
MKTTPSWTSIGIVDVSAAASQSAAGTVGEGPGEGTITGGAVTLMPVASRGLAGGSGIGRGGGVGSDEANGEGGGVGSDDAEGKGDGVGETVADGDGVVAGELVGPGSVVALGDAAGEATVVGAGVGSDADDLPIVKVHAAMKTAAAKAKRRATTARAFASARGADLC